jgi:hypothetical protein
MAATSSEQPQTAAAAEEEEAIIVDLPSTDPSKNLNYFQRVMYATRLTVDAMRKPNKSTFPKFAQESARLNFKRALQQTVDEKGWVKLAKLVVEGTRGYRVKELQELADRWHKSVDTAPAGSNEPYKLGYELMKKIWMFVYDSTDASAWKIPDDVDTKEISLIRSELGQPIADWWSDLKASASRGWANTKAGARKLKRKVFGTGESTTKKAYHITPGSPTMRYGIGTIQSYDLVTDRTNEPYVDTEQTGRFTRIADVKPYINDHMILSFSENTTGNLILPPYVYKSDSSLIPACIPYFFYSNTNWKLGKSTPSGVAFIASTWMNVHTSDPSQKSLDAIFLVPMEGNKPVTFTVDLNISHILLTQAFSDRMKYGDLYSDLQTLEGVLTRRFASTITISGRKSVFGKATKQFIQGSEEKEFRDSNLLYYRSNFTITNPDKISVRFFVDYIFKLYNSPGAYPAKQDDVTPIQQALKAKGVNTRTSYWACKEIRLMLPLRHKDFNYLSGAPN